MGGELLFSTYLEGLELVKKQNYPVVASPSIGWSTDPSGSVNLKKSALEGIGTGTDFLKQLKAEIHYIKRFKPDIVFSDTRLSSIVAANFLKIPAVLVLNQFQVMVPHEEELLNLYRIIDGSLLTLLGYGWGLSNIILIPDFPKPYTISLHSLRIPKPYEKQVRFIGAIIPEKPDDIKDETKLRESLGVQKNELLIYAGISGPRAERIPLLNRLEPIFRSLPAEYKIVMSMGDPLGASKPIQKGNLIMVPWIKNRYIFLKACDIVISRAGHETIMQSICYRKPSILIPVPKHTEQYSNARRAEELGIAAPIHQEDLCPEIMMNAINEIGNNTSYTEKLKLMNLNNQLSNGIDNCIKAVKEILNMSHKRV
jgi:UDP:flavonoid glycosyltransferase YjiC (YdhE family)